MPHPQPQDFFYINNQHNCNPRQPPIKFSKFLLRRLVIASFWSICHWAMRTEMVMVPGCSVHPGCNSNTLLEHKSNVLGGKTVKGVWKQNVSAGVPKLERCETYTVLSHVNVHKRIRATAILASHPLNLPSCC